MKRKKYSNTDPNHSLSGFKDMWKWQRERASKVKDMSFQIPGSDEIDLHYIQSNKSETAIIWIGHATFLIQAGGLNIVTDPVWANRMGFAKRLAPAGISIEDMPEIDVVLLSHGHYDHLHFPSIKRLKGNPLFLVPAGLSSLMKRHGISRVIENEWWEENKYGDITFTFVPAQHWVRRTPWDTNTSHWGGWMIEARNRNRIYFAGDSGYFQGFQQIGERFGTIDYALMPIGAYEPEWFMSPQHVSPEEAIQAFLDVKAKTFIPMHYGAYRLADDTPKEALDRLNAEWKRRGLPDHNLVIPKLGEIVKGTD